MLKGNCVIFQKGFKSLIFLKITAQNDPTGV